MLLDGCAPKEIAHILKISYDTVHFHQKNLYRKLGIQSRAELFARYSEVNKLIKDLSSANVKLKNLSTTDELTKLDNRRSFMEYLNSIWKQNMRLSLPVAVLMIDIDYFKKYNDSLGHLEGDKALAAIAKCMKDQIKRETDFIARFGGEEFVCLLPFLGKDEALHFAEKLVQSIENMRLPHPMSEHSKYVTVSVGMAITVPDNNNSQSQLLDEADKALYKAKQSGRNRVVAAVDTSPIFLKK
jgi:diguanylate cyclase (GGDEF)-like protein